MGLKGWLDNCKPVVPEEESDWDILKAKISYVSTIALMPSITLDMWPIHVLNDLRYGSKAMKAAPDFYIMSLGAAEYWIQPELECLLNKFYQDEDLSDSDLRNFYGVEIEEVILLECKEMEHKLRIDEYMANGFIAVIRDKLGEEIYILGVMGQAEDIWNEIVQKYNIPIQSLIDSHRGLGNFFDSVPLYQCILDSKNPQIMPKYYFKGKYIKAVPKGFEWIMDVKESAAGQGTSMIFKTNWKSY